MAFSLVELLVVIGIIVLLIGILVPATLGARRKAQIVATQGFLSNLGTGLQSYYNDFSAYPDSSSANTYNNQLTNGAQRLAEGLTGYLDYGTNGDGAGPSSPTATANDKEQWGFRMNNGHGKIYGPYVQITNNNFDSTNHVFLDSWGSAIIYYRADSSPGCTNFFTTSPSPLTANCVFNQYDNNVGNPTGSTDFMRKCGDVIPASPPPNNQIDAGETVVGRNSYLLISAGTDSTFLTADDILSDSK